MISPLLWKFWWDLPGQTFPVSLYFFCFYLPFTGLWGLDTGCHKKWSSVLVLCDIYSEWLSPAFPSVAAFLIGKTKQFPLLVPQLDCQRTSWDIFLLVVPPNSNDNTKINSIAKGGRWESKMQIRFLFHAIILGHCFCCRSSSPRVLRDIKQKATGKFMVFGMTTEILCEIYNKNA